MVLLVLLVVNPNTGTSVAHATRFPAPMSQQHQPRTWLPILMRDWGRYPTTSYYLNTVLDSTLYDLGCSEGSTTPDGVSVATILAFGQPWYQNGAYGAFLFGGAGFHSVSEIESAAEHYLSGFYYCAPAGSHLTLIIGTSNYGPPGQITSQHGAAWARSVNNVISWIVSGSDWSGKVSARGGIDIEQSWNSPTVTKQWVQGYNQTYVPPAYYYNYGTCEGCPYKNHESSIPNGGWSIDDVWSVSSEAAALPWPEIYLTDGTNADQWYRMSVYSSQIHHYPLYFVGALTEWQACQYNVQHGDPRCASDHVDNTPSAGWGQLQTFLYGDSRTAWRLDWSTDINQRD
jgi:hypothetical protein